MSVDSAESTCSRPNDVVSMKLKTYWLNRWSSVDKAPTLLDSVISATRVPNERAKASTVSCSIAVRKEETDPRRRIRMDMVVVSEETRTRFSASMGQGDRG